MMALIGRWHGEVDDVTNLRSCTHVGVLLKEKACSVSSKVDEPILAGISQLAHK